MKNILMLFLFIGSFCFGSSLIQNKSVTQSKRAALNIVTSSSSGAFTGSSTGQAAVTNLSVSITTTGRPVEICMQGDGTGNTGGLQIQGTGTVGTGAVYLKRGATNIYLMQLLIQANGNGAGQLLTSSVPGNFCQVDTPAAGTYTYAINYSVGNGSYFMSFNYFNLTAFEL